MITEKRKLVRGKGCRLHRFVLAWGSLTQAAITALILTLGLCPLAGAPAAASIIYTPVNQTLQL